MKRVLAALGAVLVALATITAAGPADAAYTGGGHKVLVVVEENHSRTEALAGMPYLASLANRYGQATAYYAVTHPSLPNYLAIAAGSTFGISDDNPPSSHHLTGSTVFDQAIARSRSARTYAESMPSRCALSSSGGYAVKHNPWAYFSDAGPRTHCSNNDVPAGTPSSGNLHNSTVNGTIGADSMLVPNLCNDAHDCSLSTADADLKAWMARILAGPDWTNRRLTVIVTFDEDDGSASNNVAFVVVDPRLSGKTVTLRCTHYCLTRWLDDNVGAPPLRNAAGAADLKAAFGL